MIKTIKASSLYESIRDNKELSKYKLVNGLFVVKYISKDVCIDVGDFVKKRGLFNNTKNNLIRIHQNMPKNLFNKKRKLATTTLGLWKKLNISFNEEPIEAIIK